MEKQLELIENLIGCEECGESLPDSEAKKIGDSFYCNDCAANFDICEHCNNVFNKDDLTKIDGSFYCEECKNDLFVYSDKEQDYISNDDAIYCEKCNEWFLSEDAGNFDGKYYCIDCLDEFTSVCDRCGNRDHNDYARYVGDSVYCDSCYDNYCYYCEDCDESFENDYPCGCKEKNDLIHDYRYKPDPIYFRDREKKSLFAGFELEIENGDSDTAQYLSDNFDFIYLKQDGSLDNGFEIVSHPLTWNWVKKNRAELSKMLSIKNRGCRSYNTETCGIHVHLTKKFFSELQIFKMFKFFKEEKNFILLLSQRKIENLNRWSAIESENEQILKYSKGKYNDTRYTAINLQNSNTIEFRIFRGTLHFESFMKNLEFVFSFADYIRQCSIGDVNLKSYLKYVASHKKTYKNLFNYLEAKNVHCNS